MCARSKPNAALSGTWTGDPAGRRTFGAILAVGVGVFVGACAPGPSLEDVRQLIVDELDGRALSAPAATDGGLGSQVRSESRDPTARQESRVPTARQASQANPASPACPAGM